MPDATLVIRRCTQAMLLWALVSAVAMGQSPEAVEPWVGEPSFEEEAAFEPWFGVSGQLLWLHRTEADGNQPLVVATEAGGETAVILMEDLNFPVEAGFRGSLFFGPPSGRYFELTYAGIYDQQAAVSVQTNSGTVTQTSRTFFGATTTSLTNFDYTAIYESDFHSAELNLWSGVESWRFRPMIGLRWMTQSEQYQLFETAARGNGGIADLDNDLLGGQLGFATVVWQRANWFNVQAICKAGVYRNDIGLASSLNSAGTSVASLNREFESTSCSGQVDLTATWQLTPYFNLHVGYTGLWLSEVALVGDQNDDFDIVAGTGNLDLGGVSYQGGHFGLTVTW